MQISIAAFDPAVVIRAGNILLLVALDGLIILLSVILFPFLWKD